MTSDNCPDDYNPLQEDSDLDGIGDSCEVTTCCLLRADIDHNGSVKISCVSAERASSLRFSKEDAAS